MFAGVDHRQTQVQACHQRRCDPGNLGRQDFRGANISKAMGKFPTAGVHQGRIDLVVDKAIHLQDAAPQVSSFALDAFFQYLHGSSSFVRRS